MSTSSSTPDRPITNRIKRIVAGNDPELIGELPSGFAILGKYQPGPVTGCCMLLPHRVVPSPNDLSHRERGRFFGDLVLLGDAIMQATGSTRINYLVLCNQVPELHGHCVPRFENEEPEKRRMDPFHAYDFGGARVADACGEDRDLLAKLRSALETLLEARDG